ncbi:MAG: DUF106 domain-containing protein [Nanoarchaeota archaeon]|nr:DUF106 domain-containing protein [Nanoarchaeota archaeon]MBU1004340.1 DUF106 domain-containing protein [Nanoarchaeota archaeon]MBU1946309.1 DUF106 domain-containing protein [Nanoarchaeota archaeon]
MFEGILNPVFNPLLALPIQWVVLIMAFIITLIITLIYRFTTNQSLMKQLKGEMKELQTEMKELKSEPKKMMEVQKKAMQTNMKYMSHSMRSTLFTFIPIILIFGWMTGHLAYNPILPGQDFTTTVSLYDGINGNAYIIVPEGIKLVSEINRTIDNTQLKWVLNGKEGSYILEYNIAGNTYTKDITITKEQNYAAPIKPVKDKIVKQINIDNQKMIVFNLLGWKLGWLGSYIILSIIFSMTLRKLFKVY